ncbi:hypothetical protein [Bradyrhizobium sp. 76]|jgi:hypothetical protein|uniref:hypothetical protein n=1 Tax=Bradyrhizobium sp. 76 TaxID=2782680 RepID=UPI001FF8148C|nr:hypothetical protein [Bradyrhizobium sp. 76]MCK1409415.1 hypothetical protein [Bradyrhizobium sp. 76]
MVDQKKYDGRYLLRLLEYGAFEKRPRGGWRFGAKVIGEPVVEGLLASGLVEIIGSQLKLKTLSKKARRERRARNERPAAQFPSLE